MPIKIINSRLIKFKQGLKTLAMKPFGLKEDHRIVVFKIPYPRINSLSHLLSIGLLGLEYDTRCFNDCSGKCAYPKEKIISL